MTTRRAAAWIAAVGLLATLLLFTSNHDAGHDLPTTAPESRDSLGDASPGVLTSSTVTPTIPFERPVTDPAVPTMTIPDLRERVSIEDFRLLASELALGPAAVDDRLGAHVRAVAASDGEEARRILEVAALAGAKHEALAQLLFDDRGAPSAELVSSFVRFSTNAQLDAALTVDEDMARHVPIARLRQLPPLLMPKPAERVPIGRLLRLAAHGEARALDAIERLLLPNLTQRRLPGDDTLEPADCRALIAPLDGPTRARLLTGVRESAPSRQVLRRALESLRSPCADEALDPYLQLLESVAVAEEQLRRAAVATWLVTIPAVDAAGPRLTRLCARVDPTLVLAVVATRPLPERLLWVDHLVAATAADPGPSTTLRCFLGDTISAAIKDRFGRRARASDFRVEPMDELLGRIQIPPWGASRDAYDGLVHAATIALLRSMVGESRADIGEVAKASDLGGFESVLAVSPELGRSLRALLEASAHFAPFDARDVIRALQEDDLTGPEGTLLARLALERLAATSRSERGAVQEACLYLISSHPDLSVRGTALELALTDVQDPAAITALLASLQERPEHGLAEIVGRHLPSAVSRGILTNRQFSELLLSELRDRPEDMVAGLLSELEDSLPEHVRSAAERASLSKTLESELARLPASGRSARSLQRVVARLTPPRPAASRN